MPKELLAFCAHPVGGLIVIFFFAYGVASVYTDFFSRKN